MIPALLLAIAAASAPIDPAALKSLRAIAGEDETVRYAATRVDLNGDGRAEVVATLTGRSICGSGGCLAVVLTPAGKGWRTAMRATVSRQPIALLPTRTRGWRDIGISVAGGGARAGMARMRFDGRRYPGNPTLQPALPSGSGRVLIGADDQGRPLP
jgi:hypothetical protein